MSSMTDKDLEAEINLHRQRILQGQANSTMLARLSKLEEEAKKRRLDSVVQGYQIAIALYDPHMRKLGGEVVSYICSTTAKKRFKQASDALNDRNWLVMSDESIKSSFEEITESAFPPAPEDIEEIHDKLERAIDAGGALDHVKEIRDLVIQSYIDKKYVEKMDQVIP